MHVKKTIKLKRFAEEKVVSIFSHVLKAAADVRRSKIDHGLNETYYLLRYRPYIKYIFLILTVICGSLNLPHF